MLLKARQYRNTECIKIYRSKRIQQELHEGKESSMVRMLSARKINEVLIIYEVCPYTRNQHLCLMKETDQGS